MKHKHTFQARRLFNPGRLTAMALLSGMLLVAPSTAEAQFLNKLSKGLEKVNKGLEKVEKAVKGQEPNKPGQQSKPTSPSSTSQTAPAKLNESGMKKFDLADNYPFLTRNTKFLEADPQNVSDVSEGVFAVKRGHKIEFWRLDGRKLFSADWAGAGWGWDNYPMFSGGVAPAKRASDNRICLLYLDGRVKEGDPTWQKVSNFVDGIALVEARVNYDDVYYYIDPSGKKLYPSVKIGRYIIQEAPRPLCNGLRAYYDGRKWGYMDAAGNVKLPAKYREAGDFSEGYAWVGEGQYSVDNMVLIDTTGKIVFESHLDQNAKLSPVRDGIFYMVKGNMVNYYKVDGTLLGSYEEGTAFYDGYAFVDADESMRSKPVLINTKMQTIKYLSDKVILGSDLTYHMPQFEPYGLASINTNSLVVDPMGNVVIQDYDDHHGTYINEFKQFAASGYSRVMSIQLNGERCSALMNPTGEIAWLFSENPKVAGPYTGELPPIKPIEPIEPVEPGEPGDPEPWEPWKPGDTWGPIIIVKVDQTPIGPTVVTPTKYNVSVAAKPGEGGTVNLTPSGTYNLGETATVTASPNNDWAVAKVTTSAPGQSAPKLGEPFTVTADQTVTVHFIKKDEDKAPDNTAAYQGSLSFPINDNMPYTIPVYMQINAEGTESTPYGEATYGYLALMFDPETRYTDTNHTLAVSFFAAPLKICGVQTDEATGRKWLVVDGGSVSAHDIKVSPEGGGMFGMMMNMMMAFDGFSNLNTMPRHYRIEMLDIDPETGDFTFGPLQTFSAEAGGWLSGDDKSLGKTTHGMFGSRTDKGYSADILQGVKMTIGNKRNDVQWYPPQGWAKDKNVYDQLLESMGAAYRTAQSDYNKMFEPK